MLILSAAFVASIISASLPDGLSVAFAPLAFIATAFFSYIIFGTVFGPSLLAFALLFPQPKQAIRRRPWLALRPYLLGLIILVALIVGLPAEVGWLGTLGMIAASVISLIHAGLTQRDVVSRAQLRWAIGGLTAGLAFMVPTFPSAFGWFDDPLLAELAGSGLSIGITIVGLCLAIAILRFRLFDIDVIVRRTLVYSVLTALLALVYFGGVTVLQNVFESVSGQRSALAIVLSTLLIAALFAPLRRRVQDIIDRRFFRHKYDAAQTLARFAQTVRSEVELEVLTAELLGVVQETLQPASVSVWLVETRDR